MAADQRLRWSFTVQPNLRTQGGTVAAAVDARVTLQLDYRRYPEPLVEAP